MALVGASLTAAATGEGRDIAPADNLARDSPRAGSEATRGAVRAEARSAIGGTRRQRVCTTSASGGGTMRPTSVVTHRLRRIQLCKAAVSLNVRSMRRGVARAIVVELQKDSASFGPRSPELWWALGGGYGASIRLRARIHDDMRFQQLRERVVINAGIEDGETETSAGCCLRAPQARSRRAQTRG